MLAFALAASILAAASLPHAASPQAKASATGVATTGGRRVAANTPKLVFEIAGIVTPLANQTVEYPRGTNVVLVFGAEAQKNTIAPWLAANKTNIDRRLLTLISTSSTGIVTATRFFDAYPTESVSAGINLYKVTFTYKTKITK